MNIKILISTNPFESSSASANRWLTLIEGLNGLGANVQLLIVGNYQSKAEQKKFGFESVIDGIKIKYLSSKIVVGLWQRRYFEYVGKYIQASQIKKKIKNELFDFEGVVWSENNIEIWKIINSISEKRFTLISEMSEFLDISHLNKGNALQRRLADIKQKYFENIYFQQLDGLILMTKTLFKHYNHFENPPKLLHLPMTVDLDRFKVKELPPIDFKSPYVAFVGVMNDAKDGVNILIESFSALADVHQELSLYLIGGWNYDTPQHLKRIKELGLEKRIKWMGEYKREVIPSIIMNAILLVLPRPDSKQAQGGFPTKLGEYLATGVPVCATRVGEIPDYLIDKESVFFAEPNSIESFANAMRTALKNSSNASKVGKGGKQVAEIHFNKNIQSKKLYNFLKQLQRENP
jgi:glycosyltransferase involved in cell wall biosynthesis